MDDKQTIREHYAQSLVNNSCCGPSPSADCCEDVDPDKVQVAELHGYSENELRDTVAEAFLGFGCGNPTAIASLQEGQTVLDLGCGTGFDVFLAAEQVGLEGKAIGVDMTPEMLQKARAVAEKNDIDNVDFRMGEIEHLPVGDKEIDVVISNCVINLSPSKKAVFAEVFRVLKPGGRVAVSDILKRKELPPKMKQRLSEQCNCVTGAMTTKQAQNIMRQAGLVDINIIAEEDSDAIVEDWSDEFDLSKVIYSARISAKKAAAKHV